MAAMNAQAAAMGGQFLDVENSQACRRKDPLNRIEGQIGKVLVIDGVELGVFDQPHEVGEFQDDGAAGLERGLESTREVIDIRYMGIHVITGDQVGLFALGGQLLAQRFTEELTQHGDTLLLGDGGGAGGGLDAQAGDAGGHEVLEEVTVVGGHFDDMAAATQ